MCNLNIAHRNTVYSVLMDVQTSEPHHQGAIDQNSKTQKKMVKVSESRQSMKSLTLLTCSTHGAAHGSHMLAASLRRLPSCGSFTASRLSRTAAVLDFQTEFLLFVSPCASNMASYGIVPFKTLTFPKLTNFVSGSHI
jgi:hypothetical protein